MRVYLDNCCFNRPFDDQSQPRIRLEAEAKLFIQDEITEGNLELAWSYVLDYENSANPFEERKNVVQSWRARAAVDIVASPEILQRANALQGKGLKSKDALHVACAVEMKCDYFITTDDRILRKLHGFQEIEAADPSTFIRSILHDHG